MTTVLYNTLTRLEEFTSKPSAVRVIPAVPRFTVTPYRQHAQLDVDILRRVLTYNGLQVFKSNITDVGHMTDESLMPEDKMLSRHNKRARLREIAAFTEAFLRDKERMNMLHADVYPRTDHIAKMQAMVKTLSPRSRYIGGARSTST
jgi:cysteinyl-tRNA synthetase